MDIDYICELDPDSLEPERNALWIDYFDQYRNLINMLLHDKNIGKHILPLLNLVSTYLELWIKVIGLHYGLGSDQSNEAILFTGHNFEQLMRQLHELVSWEEYEMVKDDLFCVWNIIDNLMYVPSEENISLSEATRYPITKRGSCSINECIIGYITDACNCFEENELVDMLKTLMHHTYAIYNKIYESRVL